MPSRMPEPPQHPLTDPYVNLSIHTALDPAKPPGLPIFQ